jgi:hypothetical protein
VSRVPENGMHGSRWRALETEQSWQPEMAALGKPKDLSPDLTYNCHRASARPYMQFSGVVCWLPSGRVNALSERIGLAWREWGRVWSGIFG